MAAILFFGILVLDQLAKALVKANFVPGESVDVLPQVFQITYVLNPGAAFGILGGQRLFFISAGVFLFLVAIVLSQRLRFEAPLLRYGMVALLAGAIGNLIDRVQNGLVVDFLDFQVWPVFNIADIAIVLGVSCMMVAILFPKRFPKRFEKRFAKGR